MKRMKRGFLDSLRLYVRGGSGGMGYPRFGGVGGNGGNIYVEAKEDCNLLKTLKAHPDKRWCSDSGANSRQFRILGEQGKDVCIPVPVGTSVRLDDQRLIGELNQIGDKILVARGGVGGSPNNQYNGQKGQAHHIILELKLIADIGLVGFPNAGKSTLLKAISNAKPKIASYPFTTLKPNLGMAEFKDGRQISIADLPGLVEGSWANVGMGHKFLKHVERTKMLLFMVDINGFRLGPKYPYRSATENVVLLNKELELYSPDLVEKPSLLVVNKMDSPFAEDKLKRLLDELQHIKDVCARFPEEMCPDQFVVFDEIIPCSAKENKESVDYVKRRLRELLDFYDDQEREVQELVVKSRAKSKLIETNLKLV